MSLVTRSKLHLAHGSKDSCSLHRWVLLKNSIIHALPSASCAPAAANANANLVYSPEEEEEEEEVCCDDEHDSFMFPDAGKLANSAGDSMEEQWFDSLLETLEVDEEDAAVHASLLHADDDDDYAPFTPATSPMSSSDDLVSTPVYNDPPISMPYPVVYPAYHPPLLLPPLPALDSSFPPISVALPYYDADAVSDGSDDELDELATPTLTRSSVSSSAESEHPLSDSILSHSRRGLRRRGSPEVYGSPYVYAFELDPLPFPELSHNAAHPMFNSLYDSEC
ncbi:hypothetical protein FA95DRAFT_1498417 [Auriscalpium vulgare]|uniref:Uncharacterized protein n=1 Tax=Auriscalpium vulgare TaxID=40419 RepID=A0ACB8RHY6_9AGAM|nr:hypothetical protein FA95DRAFT_1498417 [Auriscalpium vulgare]